jgi:hypothetical protein
MQQGNVFHHKVSPLISAIKIKVDEVGKACQTEDNAIDDLQTSMGVTMGRYMTGKLTFI